MKAALYIRVSTDRQTGENQIAELRQLAAARGFEPVLYEEVESAVKARPVLDRMLADVRAGRPRRTGEIRPTMDGSRPANSQDPRPVRFYPAASSFCNVCRVRQLRGPHLRTWAWWRRRSSMAETAATSPSSFPQSSTGRLEVMRVEARS